MAPNLQLEMTLATATPTLKEEDTEKEPATH